MNVRLALVGLIGFFWGGFATPFSIRLSHAFNIIDKPEGRKIHAAPTPRGAGIVLWSGYLLWSLYSVDKAGASALFIRCAALSATMVFLCGYMDDMRGLNPFIRLALHAASAFIVVAPLRMPLIPAVLSIGWIAGTTSAYNLIDGVNGLCSSIFIASSLTLYALFGDAFGIVGAAMTLGVLCWNFPSARTFLGDGGSTLLGFLFSSYFISLASFVIVKIWPHEIILLFLLLGGVPVLDTLFAFTRRTLAGKSPFYPDRGHLHHILLDKTGSPFWTVTCLLTLHGALLAAGAAALMKLRTAGVF
ncbi:undecaprenyl-phosphate alpha-N-acetylglucosaminyl 1-phosphate transferase [Synergistales bacterium]|nr:undecaprenyl-phosphate alpha-N-acetylglucosaminyl 1-phosphate transferase [Synergistales bacterium]